MKFYYCEISKQSWCSWKTLTYKAGTYYCYQSQKYPVVSLGSSLRSEPHSTNQQVEKIIIQPYFTTYLEHRMDSSAPEVCLTGKTPANTDLSARISQANIEIGNAMKSNLLHLDRNGHFGCGLWGNQAVIQTLHLSCLFERHMHAGVTRFIILSFIWWEHYKGIGSLSPRKCLWSSFPPHHPAPRCCFMSL